MTSTLIGKRAVVVGAGMAGLPAARALADYFEQVVVLERDGLPFERLIEPGSHRGGMRTHSSPADSARSVTSFRALNRISLKPARCRSMQASTFASKDPATTLFQRAISAWSYPPCHGR
jgi:glycine/D-amino acid oxidase-like deaminating enzyme